MEVSIFLHGGIVRMHAKYVCQETDLVDADGFSKQPHLVHDPGGVLGVLFTDELHEAIALVILRDPVLGQMHIHDPPSLEHELPYQAVRHPLIDVADVDRGFLVLLPRDLC